MRINGYLCAVFIQRRKGCYKCKSRGAKVRKEVSCPVEQLSWLISEHAAQVKEKVGPAPDQVAGNMEQAAHDVL